MQRGIKKSVNREAGTSLFQSDSKLQIPFPGRDARHETPHQRNCAVMDGADEGISAELWGKSQN